MEATSTVIKGVGKARNDFPAIVNQIERLTDWRFVERRDGYRVVVADLDGMMEVLRECRHFQPHVSPTATGYAIMLPELGVHGEGVSLEGAEDDLIDAVLEYCDDWHGFLATAPNHAERRWWVFLIEAASVVSGPEGVRRLLFGQ